MIPSANERAACEICSAPILHLSTHVRDVEPADMKRRVRALMASQDTQSAH